MMKIQCVWEHNGNDTLLYSCSFPGAYTRGPSKEEALSKMADEIRSFCEWSGVTLTEKAESEIIQEKASELRISDADSDVLFDTEREPLTLEEYQELKALALKSAEDFFALYQSFPDKHVSSLPERKTFYGQVPRTAEEMYQHTKSVNVYYFGEIDINADTEGSIQECRQKGFAALEEKPDFLSSAVIDGSYGELWSVRKVLRRFIWHDRIHAKAMYRMGVKTFGEGVVANPFGF